MPSDADLIRACKIWDKITEKMHKREFEMPSELEHASSNQPYAESDYHPLRCQIDGKVAELTVGSSAGHKVHVDLEKKTLQYYDTDAGPNEVMHDLLEEAGLRCETEHAGVTCTELTKENVQEVFKVLAMPTSMDFRLNECQKSKVDPEEVCEEEKDNTSFRDLGYREPPSGCDCSEFWDEYVQNCVDNFDYSSYDTSEGEDCKEIEKNFFKSGPQKETLTKQEANIIPKSQTKMTEW